MNTSRLGSLIRRLAAAAVLSAAVATPVLAADPLVSPAWLNSHRADANVVVLDIRSAIDGGGADAFVQGHIPGAIHSDYDKAGWRVERKGVPFMLPTVAELEKLIGELGIDEDSTVVVVPAGVHVTDFGSAARVYWTLKTVGIANVSILDGGLAAWKKQNLAIESGKKAPSPKIFTANFNRNILADSAVVKKAQQAGNVTLIDARPESFFLGKEKAPAASAYGHIPGAISLDSASFYDAASNRLKPKAQLAALAASLPDRPSIAYCNTGHWAATDWFVLHELLGRKEVRLYDGSMVEWTSHHERPVASARTKWDDLKKALGIGS
jgi:thiosulfate/3-mercaptopyruvate sulfurtransferase